MPSSPSHTANRNSILDIGNARRGDAISAVTPEWTASDSNCFFHALDAFQPGTVTRQLFLAQVGVVMAVKDHKLRKEINELLSRYNEVSPFPNYNAAWSDPSLANYMAWCDAMEYLWAGEVELQLWALLNEKKILVFALGNGEFIHHGALNTFPHRNDPHRDDDDWPSIWIAHVNADGPVVAATANHANHYIALHQRPKGPLSLPAIPTGYECISCSLLPP